MRSCIALFLCSAVFAQKPFHSAELIFPQEKWHNHASSIVELPNGELFVCWYHGSGERNADDVIVEGARKPRGAREWSPRFLLADTPGFPDTNPALFLDSKNRLWLWWQAIVANRWESAITKYRISSDYARPGPPKWATSDTLLIVPRNFAERVKAFFDPLPAGKYRDHVLAHADDKYFSRMGWMTRAHPLELPGGRILVPLYSDGYSFSLVAISDDGGATWFASEPIVGLGSVQPSLVRKKDGTIVAYMRDNGPPPKRVPVSLSSDGGETWTPAADSGIPNPGAGMETIALRDGLWAMIYNDLERGRHSLLVALSDDEGATWKWKRHLEIQPEGQGQFHYPSLIQARDGSLHASYSFFNANGKSIKHAHFNVEWVKATPEVIAYSEAGGETLTMDFYPGAGPGPHPVAILVHGGGFTGGTSRNNSEAYCADFLAPAGYAVFSVNYRLAPKHPYPAMIEDVETAIRFVRANAKRWHADPNRIALIGGSAGGYLSNMVGIRRKEPVHAVVTLFGSSDLRNRELSGGLAALLGPLAKEKGALAALTEASPVVHITGKEPPFLLIHGDNDDVVPLSQSTHLQAALKSAGVRCDLIIIPKGPHATGRWHLIPGAPAWEREMAEWLNAALRHRGPIGEGIRPRH